MPITKGAPSCQEGVNGYEGIKHPAEYDEWPPGHSATEQQEGPRGSLVARSEPGTGQAPSGSEGDDYSRGSHGQDAVKQP